MRQKPYTKRYPNKKEADLAVKDLRSNGSFAWTEAKYGENRMTGVVRLTLIGYDVFWVTSAQMTAMFDRA